MWSENVRRIFVEHARRADVTVEEYTRNRVSTIPAGRFLDPVECAAVIAFLVSDDSQFITGAILPITGGSPTQVNERWCSE